MPSQHVMQILQLDPTTVKHLLSRKQTPVKRDIPSEQINALPKKAIMKVATKKVVVSDMEACAHIMTKLHEEQLAQTFQKQSVKNS